ncbi:hypothetical protein Holit_01849 [Hollandina sp. SP2]
MILFGFVNDYRGSFRNSKYHPSGSSPQTKRIKAYQFSWRKRLKSYLSALKKLSRRPDPFRATRYCSSPKNNSVLNKNASRFIRQKFSLLCFSPCPKLYFSTVLCSFSIFHRTLPHPATCSAFPSSIALFLIQRL